MLTKKKRAYAEARKSGKNVTDSAIAAGYSEATARQSGSRLERDEDVIRYIAGKEEIKTTKPLPEPIDGMHIPVHKNTNDALDFMRSVMNDNGEDMRIRLDAAKALASYTVPKPGEKGKKEQKEERARQAASKFTGLRSVK